jgi:hypothetical protein
VAPRKATTLADRILAAVPLASIYLWLCVVYAVEAWRRITPWLFTDELEMTQISRSIAATGHAARRGDPYTYRSLYPVLTAPLWWLHDVAASYSAIKYLDVFVMTSVIFPTYFLARMLLPKWWSIFAATGAAMIPSLAYSSWIVEETFAYPYAVLAVLLIAKALVHRSRGWVIAAVAASLVAPAVRGELIVIPIAAVFAVLFAVWSSEWGRARRASWTTSDWVGFFVLLAGALILTSALGSHFSQPWYEVTQYWKHRILVMGNWAAGSLAIGIGIIPLVLGLAGLVPARGEEQSRELRMVRCAVTGAIAAFALYTGMKAAYLSTTFETRVEERNLIYIAPLLFVFTALVLHRRRVNPIALAVAVVYGFYLVVGTPFHMNTQLYSDALGLAILQQANRFFEWTPSFAQWILLLLLAVGTAMTVAVLVLRDRARVAGAIGVALAAGILAWSVTGEIAAAAGSASVARDTEDALSHPFTWVDDHTGGKPTLYLAQGVADPTSEWLLEFWNRSIAGVSSLDSTIGGPGPAGAPNITARGQLYWTLEPNEPVPGNRVYDYAVEEWPCIDFTGPVVATHDYQSGALTREWRLVKLTQPSRLRAACTGIYADGWSTDKDSSYFRFTAKKPGWLRIDLSRQNWGSTPVHLQIASIATDQKQPVVGDVEQSQTFVVESNKPKTIWLRTPAHPFVVRTVVEKKFVPREVNPNFGDPRTLGALVDYRFFTKKPRTAP